MFRFRTVFVGLTSWRESTRVHSRLLFLVLLALVLHGEMISICFRVLVESSHVLKDQSGDGKIAVYHAKTL